MVTPPSPTWVKKFDIPSLPVSTDDLAIGNAQLTVGAVGAADAPPITPAGYLKLDGFLVPYYNKPAANPSWRSSGTPTQGPGGFFVNKPAGLTLGDLIVIAGAKLYGAGHSLSSPSGFTDVINNDGILLTSKVADSGDVGGTGWTVVNNGSLDGIAVAMAFEEAMLEAYYASYFAGAKTLTPSDVGRIVVPGFSGFQLNGLPVIVSFNAGTSNLSLSQWSDPEIANIPGETWDVRVNGATYYYCANVWVGDAIISAAATGDFSYLGSDVGFGGISEEYEYDTIAFVLEPTP
jgi:hypothetical protein